MKLTEEQIKQFVGYCDEETHLTIHGFNDIGQRFETVARVSRTDDAKPAVFDERIFFEYGKKRNMPHLDFLAPFRVEYKPDGLYGTDLIIEKICLENGEVVYQNPDAELYYEIAQRQGEELSQKNRSNGRELTELDPITKALEGCIAKPVILDGNRWGVLASYGGANDFGETMINVLGETFCGERSIPSSAQLLTCDVDGNVSHVETNGKFMKEFRNIERIYAERVERIKQAQKEPGDIE